ncbi:MAG: transporter [Acidimicrobiales bacterium]
MTRLALRQFRSEAAVAVAALAVVAVVLGVTGPHLVHVYRTTPRQLGDTYGALQNALSALLLVAPALAGIFFGAPLVARELETGTFRLAWTQSVGRSRWLLVKYAVVGTAASVLAGGLSLMAAWWANPIDVWEQNRFTPSAFGMFGIVPFGYALFAFALGATAGLVCRRTLPAMVATLVGYVGARYVATYWIRPHLEAPLRLSLPLAKAGGVGFVVSPTGGVVMTVSPPDVANAWPLSASVVDGAGRSPTPQVLARTCPTVARGGGAPAPALGVGGAHHVRPAPGGGFQACVEHLAARYHVVMTYQPASRYWPFQAYETALFVLAAVALAALGVWWVRRRAA